MTNVRQKRWNIHADLSVLYQRLDASVEAYDREPSDANRAAVVRLEEEVVAKELELARTESGVGGQEPPRGKPSATAEYPPEQGDLSEDREAKFKREITRATGEPPRSQIEQIKETIAGRVFNFPEGELPAGLEIPDIGKLGVLPEHGAQPFRAVPAGAFSGRNKALKALKKALDESRDENLDHLLVDCIRTLSRAHLFTVGGHHVVRMELYCLQANWSAVRATLDVLKALYEV